MRRCVQDKWCPWYRAQLYHSRALFLLAGLSFLILLRARYGKAHWQSSRNREVFMLAWASAAYQSNTSSCTWAERGTNSTQEHGLDLPAVRWPWSSTADAAGPLLYRLYPSWHCWLFLDIPVSHYYGIDIVHMHKKADNQQAYIDVFPKVGVTWCRADTCE